MVSRPWTCHFRPACPPRDGDEAACVNIRSVRPRRVTIPSSHNPYLLQIMDYVILMLVSHDDDRWVVTHHHDETSRLGFTTLLQGHFHCVETARRIRHDNHLIVQKLTRQSLASLRSPRLVKILPVSSHTKLGLPGSDHHFQDRRPTQLGGHAAQVSSNSFRRISSRKLHQLYIERIPNLHSILLRLVSPETAPLWEAALDI